MYDFTREDVDVETIRARFAAMDDATRTLLRAEAFEGHQISLSFFFVPARARVFALETLGEEATPGGPPESFRAHIGGVAPGVVLYE